jgi:hypothetical protein
MTIGVLFWVLYIVGLIFFGLGVYRDRGVLGLTPLFWWVLIFLLGVGEFGWPLK